MGISNEFRTTIEENGWYASLKSLWYPNEDLLSRYSLLSLIAEWNNYVLPITKLYIGITESFEKLGITIQQVLTLQRWRIVCRRLQVLW